MSFAQLRLVCSVTALWAVGFGIGAQATSHWLKLHDASDSLIGFVHASYYFGVAVAAVGVPRLTTRFGLGTTGLGLFLSALTLVLFPFAGSAAGWLVIRLLSGAGCALSLIPLETYLSRKSPRERRAEIFGYYAVALTLAGAIGIVLGLEAFAADGLLIRILGATRNTFFLGALFPLIGSMIAQHGLSRVEWDAADRSDARPLSLRSHFLSFGTAWGQGFLEGGMLAFLSLYLLSQGMTAAAAGALMGVTMIGMIAFQVPVAWIADRRGRVPTLLACYVVTMSGLLLVPFCVSHVWLGFWLLLVGACAGAMYPLGLSLLDDQLTSDQLVRAYAWYLAMECIGSQCGAAVMGRARDLWGGGAMFVVAALALIGVLSVWGWLTWRAKSMRAAQRAEQIRRAA